MKLLGPCVDSLPRVQWLSELLVQNRMESLYGFTCKRLGSFEILIVREFL